MQFQTGTQLDEIVDVESVTAVDVGSAIAIIIIAVVVATVVRRIMQKYLKRLDQLSDPVGIAVSRGVFLLIIVLGVLLALPRLGFQIEPAMILVLMAAVLFFFAARPLMEDFSASLILQTRTPFVVGDTIRHAGFLGVVEDIDGRSTVIVTPSGETVRIRNTTILAEPIINLTASKFRRSEIEVGVAYGTNLDRAAEILLGAVVDLPSVVRDPEPQVLVTEFDDSAITMEIRVWHLPTILDGFVAQDEVIRSVDRACRREGIVIAFPQRDVWMRTQATSPNPTQLDE
jgi:small-conductance mechanosensitive channel